MSVRLVRDGSGGYVTADGRWTVTPVDGMGAGVNNNRGWSNGKRVWRVTDTSRRATLSAYGDPHSAIRDRLWEVRDLITDCSPDECRCMTEDPGDGFGERVVTHSSRCPEHPEAGAS